MSGNRLAARQQRLRSACRWALAAAGGAILLQTGSCAIDPDLILQAVVQVATETLIFFTDNALAGLS